MTVPVPDDLVQAVREKCPPSGAPWGDTWVLGAVPPGWAKILVEGKPKWVRVGGWVLIGGKPFLQVNP